MQIDIPLNKDAKLNKFLHTMATIRIQISLLPKINFYSVRVKNVIYKDHIYEFIGLPTMMDTIWSLFIVEEAHTCQDSCIAITRNALSPQHSLLQLTQAPSNKTQSAGAAEYTDCFSAERVRLPNKCHEYDTKQSDGEASVMLELWGMQSTPLLPLLPGPL